MKKFALFCRGTKLYMSALIFKLKTKIYGRGARMIAIFRHFEKFEKVDPINFALVFS
ncbi:hypothetical protein [Sphingobacterium kitahiroshimense]|uniref:Uncharacterized protein n=1 Tax=Sphingobacterium kitahiroshimense TaxID=470446 RepID=A0ABV0C1X6_9SPHI